MLTTKSLSMRRKTPLSLFQGVAGSFFFLDQTLGKQPLPTQIRTYIPYSVYYRIPITWRTRYNIRIYPRLVPVLLQTWRVGSVLVLQVTSHLTHSLVARRIRITIIYALRMRVGLTDFREHQAKRHAWAEWQRFRSCSRSQFASHEPLTARSELLCCVGQPSVYTYILGIVFGDEVSRNSSHNYCLQLLSSQQEAKRTKKYYVMHKIGG